MLPLQAVKGFGELAKALQFAGLITLLRHGGNQTVPHNLMNNSSADITSFRVASQRVSTEKDAVGSAVRLLVLIMGGGCALRGHVFILCKAVAFTWPRPLGCDCQRVCWYTSG